MSSIRIRPRLFYQARLEEELQACTPWLAEVLSRPRLSLFECFLGSVSIGNRVLLCTTELEWIQLSRVSRECSICASHVFALQR